MSSQSRTLSLLGAQYPDSPSNLMTAAIVNNRSLDGTLVSAEDVGTSGLEVVSLNSELLSLSLVLYGFLSGEAPHLNIDPILATKCKKALVDLGELTLSDDEFLNLFGEAIKIWPDIIKADHSLTLAEIEKANSQTVDVHKKNPQIITSSLIKNHLLNTLDASALIESMRHYVARIYQKAKLHMDEK